MLTRRVLFVGLTAALLSSACSKPEPPRLTPKEAQVTAVGPAGINVLLKMEATNPNRVTLSAQSVTGKAKLDGKWDMGTVTITKPVVLPPGVPTMIDVPMTLPWTDMKTLAALAAAPGPVPYVVEGTVTVGGERLNVDVPFTLSGTITREQIAGALLKSLPTIPGLAPAP
ncbi:MAG TPA: LEA type 2 family protein [Labilithrix sp.]|nr:LEA type 2 family protein [Labilithrix sp.]